MPARLVLCAVCILCAAICSSAAPQQTASANTRLQQAQQAYAAGQRQQAESLLQQAIAEAERAKSPENLAAALTAYAQLLGEQRRATDAGRCFERIFAVRVRQLGIDHPQSLQAYRDVRDYYAVLGMPQQAEAFLGHEIALREKSSGADQLFSAGAMMDLANLLNSQRRHADAEPLNLRAVAIREAALGPDHPKLAASLYNLGLTCSELGKWDESAAAYERALAIYEKHPDQQGGVARTLTNLGHVYQHSSQSPQAERTMLRGIAYWERVQGPNDPAVALTAGNLGRLYLERKEPWLAEPLFARALRIAEQLHGPQSPEAAKYLGFLGSAYYTQQKFDRAEELHRRELAILTAILPPDDRDIARAAANLAQLAIVRKDLPAAERLFQQSLEINIQHLSPHDTAAADTLGALAGVLLHQAKLSEAIALLDAHLPRVRQALGADSEYVAYRLGDYGHVLAKAGRRPEAHAAFEEAVQILQRRFGPDHSQTRQMAASYASYFPKKSPPPAASVSAAPSSASSSAPPPAPAPSVEEQKEQRWLALNDAANRAMIEGRTAEAENHFKQLLQFVAPLPPTEARWQEAYSRVGGFYQHLGKHGEAEAIYRQALATREQALGPSHEALLQNLYDLAMFCMVTQRPAEAEPLLVRAAMLQERISGPDHPYVASYVLWLGTALDQQGKAAEATIHLQRALRIRTEKLGADNPETLQAMKALARNQARLGNLAETQRLFDAALATVAKLHGHRSRPYAATLQEYAHALRLAGDSKAATELEARATALR